MSLLQRFYISIILLLGMSSVAFANTHPIELLPDVPIQHEGTHIVINLPQTRLFLFQNGELEGVYPVAVGKMLTQTPTGDFKITGIYPHPSWHVPRSIQEEMKREGKPVLTVVPPGKDNPLGPVFIRFGEQSLGLGIHGTNAPWSVPGFRSHGCVRMKSPDAEKLSGLVSKGADVSVVYQTILLSEDANGELWLSAYRNLYKQADPSLPLLAKELVRWQSDNRRPVFGARVNSALKKRNGLPVCLTCQHPKLAVIQSPMTTIAWEQHATSPASTVAKSQVKPEPLMDDSTQSLVPVVQKQNASAPQGLAVEPSKKAQKVPSSAMDYLL